MVVQEDHIRLRPWKPATELPASELAGDLVALPTLCGKHVARYPSVLIGEAMTSRFYAFVVSCDCGIAYLIHTEPDGAHCKAAGDPAGIAGRYDHLPGDEGTFTSGPATFKCKPLLRVMKLCLDSNTPVPPDALQGAVDSFRRRLSFAGVMQREAGISTGRVVRCRAAVPGWPGGRGRASPGLRAGTEVRSSLVRPPRSPLPSGPSATPRCCC